MAKPDLVPRTRRNAIHWLTDNGTVACGTALDMDRTATCLTRDGTKVTCRDCHETWPFSTTKQDWTGAKP